MLKKYFEDKGEADQRTQIITTILSHPLDSAAPATKGFEVISLYPDENGYPSLENLKAVVSEKTAGIFITNPEDTGVFNPIIREFVDVVHEAGGLCVCDMADYNGLFGLVRAKELGARPITDQLVALKFNYLALSVVFLCPLILLFLLASPDTGHILSFGILILGGALLLLYLKESLMLFLSKKISILHWFLYLCAVEIFPVSFVWLSLTRI